MVGDAIDQCLARAEKQFDDRIRALGGTATPSAAQAKRAVKTAVTIFRELRDTFAAVAEVFRLTRAELEDIASKR